MPRVKLTVAYEGTEFHGWQKQVDPNGQPLRTAQGVLEQAVREVVREPVNVVGASRTDAGVHARAQVAAFTASELRIPVGKIALAVNSRLPGDVQVRRAALVDDAFDPISDCLAKGYRYRIFHAGSRRVPTPLFSRRLLCRSRHSLDVPAMNDAARRLLGEHDFASFAQVDHGRETTVRTIHECKVTATAHNRCHLDIAGSGFLYNMVRIIAGTLHEVGRGRLGPEAIEPILAARDRTRAGPTMPPEGLCLMWIRYPEPAARPA